MTKGILNPAWSIGKLLQVYNLVKDRMTNESQCRRMGEVRRTEQEVGTKSKRAWKGAENTRTKEVAQWGHAGRAPTQRRS